MKKAVKTPVIEVKGLTKIYQADGAAVPALRGVSFKVSPGEFVSVVGPSGSGKSTLMHLLGVLDRPTSGEVIVDGMETGNLREKELALIRRGKVGFIFETFNLLPRLSVLRNVELPLVYENLGPSKRRKRAQEALVGVGLAPRLNHLPSLLSPAEQQKVAIARALVNDPLLILADEPTGNLDSNSGKEILSLLELLNEQGKTVLLATHEPHLAHHAHRLIQLLDGSVVSDKRVKSRLSAKKAVLEE